MALVCSIEAAALHKGLMGDIDGAVKTALDAHREVVRLFPALPVHPLVEHLFLPLSLFTGDPDTHLVVMLRLMDRFAQCIPQFQLEALVLLGLCRRVPALLRKQIGLELLQHESVIGNTRYHAYALCALGEAAQSETLLERGVQEALDSGQDFLELLCLKPLLSIAGRNAVRWQGRHDSLWASLQSENGPIASDRKRSTPLARSPHSLAHASSTILRSSPVGMHLTEQPGMRRRHSTFEQMSPVRSYVRDRPDSSLRVASSPPSVDSPKGPRK